MSLWRTIKYKTDIHTLLILFLHLLNTLFMPMCIVQGRYLQNKMPCLPIWTILDNSHNENATIKGIYQLVHLHSLIRDFTMCIKHPWVIDVRLQRPIISTERVPRHTYWNLVAISLTSKTTLIYVLFPVWNTCI